MAHGDARLLHRGGREGREADDVAGRVDVGDRGLVVLVHGDEAAVVRGQAGQVEGRVVGRAVSPGGEEHPVDPEVAVGQAQENRVRVRVEDGFEQRGVAPQVDTQEAHLKAKVLADLPVEEGQQVFARKRRASP